MKSGESLNSALARQQRKVMAMRNIILTVLLASPWLTLQIMYLHFWPQINPGVILTSMLVLIQILSGLLVLFVLLHIWGLLQKIPIINKYFF